MSVLDDIKNQFLGGTYLTRLIIANVAVFVFFLILEMLGFLITGRSGGITDYVLPWLMLPSDLVAFITRPWTIFTYMFLHADFWHLFTNMIVLFFTGRIFLEFLGDRRLLTVFLYGGIAGGMLFIILYNISPAFTAGAPLVGASAGVAAVLVAAATYMPRLPVRLFFLLEVPLWSVAALMVLGFVSGVMGGNGGGNLAHLGGAAVGYVFVLQLRKGIDWSIGFFNFLDRIGQWTKPKPKVHKVYQSASKTTTTRSTDEQAQVDAILDKISKSGYEKLSKAEKDFLFKFGKK